MKPTYDQLVEIVESLQKENKELKRRIEHLENELRKYVNENTPSGSIPPYLKKLEDVVDRYSKDDDDKEPPKDNSRNARPKHIDRKEHHSLEKPVCPRCGGRARRRGTSTRKRIVIEMQLPRAETVEHESDIYQCKECGKVFSAPVPNALPKTEFDILTTVFISYLSNAAKMSIDDIKSLLHLFGVGVSEGSITNAMKRLKYYLGEYYDNLLEEVKTSFSRHKDETSHRFNGKNFWTWVIATTDWVYYTIQKNRSHIIAKALESTEGVDVVDGYAAYDGLKCKKQRCWAHLLRIAKKPRYSFGKEESFDRYKSFVKKLSLLYQYAKADKRKRGASKKLKEMYQLRLWELIKGAPPEGKNINRLLDYISAFFLEWFTFLEYKEVDPTNNRAERALRPLVIKRRISQQSRGTDNMDSYAMQMSMYMTTRLQGTDYMKTLSDTLKSGVSSTPHKF